MKLRISICFLLLFMVGLGVHAVYVADHPQKFAIEQTQGIAPVNVDYVHGLVAEQASVKTEARVVMKAQVGTDVPTDPGDSKGFLLAHWGALLGGLLSFVEVIIRLTPTEKDNSIFNIVKIILDAIIPNRRNPSGTHP